MSFCTRCGKQIAEGAVCECSASTKPLIAIDGAAAQGFWESMKNRMGIGDPERNSTDTYERDMKIVPDCISANENEIPIKQYNIAVLRNLLRFERAEGRMQVTNKRVIFRAAGRSIGGRTTLQQEFAIDELAGIEAKRSYRFSFFHVLFGLLVVLFAASIGISIVLSGSDMGRYSSTPIEVLMMSLFAFFSGYSVNIGALSVILGLLFGFGGLAPFFMVKGRFLLKLLPLGVSFGSFSAIALTGNGLINLFLLLSLLITIFGLLLYCIRPDFAILVKNKGAMEQSPPIYIRRSRGFWAWRQDGGTGFSEVMPTDESERAIREIGAMINDIQKLGDFGLEKWVSK